MPRPKGSKNKAKTSSIPTTDFTSLIAENGCNNEIISEEDLIILLSETLGVPYNGLDNLNPDDYECIYKVTIYTTVTAYEDEEYRKIQNGGILAMPDGGPLSSVGQKRGFKNMKRTIGPSLMGEIFKISASKGYRHYFYGSTDETLEKLYSVLTESYPGIQIAGMYSPPFRPMTEDEDKAIIERINETKSDFVWVGLGVTFVSHMWSTINCAKSEQSTTFAFTPPKPFNNCISPLST